MGGCTQGDGWAWAASVQPAPALRRRARLPLLLQLGLWGAAAAQRGWWAQGMVGDTPHPSQAPHPKARACTPGSARCASAACTSGCSRCPSWSIQRPPGGQQRVAGRAAGWV